VAEVRGTPTAGWTWSPAGAAGSGSTGSPRPPPTSSPRSASCPRRPGEAAEQRSVKAGRLFTRYVATLLEMTGGEVEAIDIPEDPVAASYLVAAGLQVDLADKQRCGLPSAAERARPPRRPCSAASSSSSSISGTPARSHRDPVSVN
jgi:hypothetical protein